MPIDMDKLRGRERMVDIDGVGTLVFREPTLADAQRAGGDPFWWVGCVRCQDGTPFISNPQEAGQIRSDLAGAIIAEVTRTRPTDAPSEGSGASQTTQAE